ncbi:MAG: DUF1697 domain-containing protein [Clostridia bacterium]|nr:DUF1697 domain-containing protein [Clostridia bacterium]
MKRFIALLRGVNMFGKNKVTMAELKQVFENLAFSDVKTYLNSGNVLFSCNEDDTLLLTERIETAIKAQFGAAVPVFVIATERLEAILKAAPSWWGTGDKAIYDTLIFIMPPATVSDVLFEFGEPKEGLERVMECGDALFWSYSRTDYQKTNWWSKTATTPIAPKLTIRTANTVRKLVEL